tara:strand:- start:2800 stop:3885 length:1086 start_codon:yes stop_codon:yes gene_type:complete
MNNIKEIEHLIDDCNSKLNCILSLEKNNQDQDKLIIKLLGLGGQFKTQKQKIIILIILLAVFIPFTYIFGFFMMIFYVVAIYALFVDTVFEIDKEIIAKKALLFNKIIVSKKEINCNELDRFEVVRNEYRTKDGTKVNYKLTAIFKNEKKLVIYTGFDPALLNALDNLIEKFLGIEDESNKSQLLDIKKSKTQVAFEKEIQQTNLDTSKPSKSFPFEINSNLIKDDIIYFSNFNHKSLGIFLVIFGALFTFGSCFVFSPIGIPLFLWGLRKLINKQYVNVTQQKIVYFTKPISLKKQKELLKSRITKVEVVDSGVTTNGVMSYHLIAISKDKSKHKLIRHSFNAPAMEEICKIINKRLGLS